MSSSSNSTSAGTSSRISSSTSSHISSTSIATSSSVTSSSSILSTSSQSVIISTSIVTASFPTTSVLSNGDVTTIYSTSTNVVTQTEPAQGSGSTGAAAAATSGAGGLATPSNQSSGSSNTTTIAVATVVPIVAVALLLLAGIWFWRKRKQSKNAEEMRRKEMEEYGFNPNNDPTLATIGSTNGDDPSTIRERDAGYRGWGTTSANTRKASTTMSSNPGIARSDSGGRGFNGQPSPTGMDGHSDDPLVNGGAGATDDVAALGTAPSASSNRGGGVHRGPSNASSAYSGANYSDVSGDGPLPTGSAQDYGGFIHPDEAVGTAHYGDGGWAAQPVIKDVSARRNTRIENPSVIPHQGGIAQNF